MKIFNAIKEHKILLLVLTALALYIAFLAKDKTYPDDFYKQFFNKTNKEMQNELKDLKGVASSYTKDNKYVKNYQETMYDCIGYKIFHNKENKKFSSTLNECNDDYKTNKQATYYNHAWLMREFSVWNGGYQPLERIIQKHLKESKTYEHIKTTYTMNFTDKRPHMFVSIDFRGANIGGYMLDRTMEVKVDAKTKELYDLK